MKINKITNLIGQTPLIKIQSLSLQTTTNIFGKLEFFNPMGSVKDRVALAMIENAEKTKLIQPGDTIIEATSGNTGIGLAFVGVSRGYRVIIVMPDSMSKERGLLLKQLGAELVLTPGSGGMQSAIEKAIELQQQIPQSFMPKQFENLANPKIHYQTTAPEIWNDLNGKIDVFIAGVGTGGTIMGCAQFFKENNPNIQIIAVEPAESAVLSGEKPGKHRIQGIGAGFIPKLINQKKYDEVIKVSSSNAIVMSNYLAYQEGLLVGYSSGATAVAAIKIAERSNNQNKNIVVIFPDSKERYLTEN